jgi:hypothetical protein
VNRTSTLEDSLDEEFGALARAGVMAPLLGSAERELHAPPFDAAACTRAGTLFLDNVENFLLAAASTAAGPRLVCAVTQGNEKSDVTAVGGSIVIAEFFARVCGPRASSDLEGDMHAALSRAAERFQEARASTEPLRRWRFRASGIGAVRDLRGVSTSLTALALSTSHGFLAHAGETLAHRVRAERPERLSADHSLGARPEFQAEVRRDPSLSCHADACAVTFDGSLGASGTAAVVKVDVRPGDVFVLTGGILGKLARDASVLRRAAAATSSKEACRVVAEAAPTERSSHEGVTTVVVRHLG